MTVILGIDPGSRKLGFAFVEIKAKAFKHLHSGVLDLDTNTDLAERIHETDAALSPLIKTYHAKDMAIEDIFFAKFPKAAIKLAHVRGACMLMAKQAGMGVHAYPPALVKKTVIGHGAADKTQVARMISAMLGLKGARPLDETDACAVAIVHGIAKGNMTLRGSTGR